MQRAGVYATLGNFKIIQSLLELWMQLQSRWSIRIQSLSDDEVFGSNLDGVSRLMSSIASFCRESLKIIQTNFDDQVLPIGSENIEAEGLRAVEACMMFMTRADTREWYENGGQP